MHLVVDASVAVKWLVAEDDSDAAEGLLTADDDLHAPRLMASEIANALWRKTRTGEIEPGHAGTLMAAVSAMPLHWSSDETLCADAVRLAAALDRPVYDCVYLALAHRVDARLVTADVRFANALATTEHGATVVTLQAYAKERR